MTTKNNRVVLNLSIEQAIKLQALFDAITSEGSTNPDKEFFQKLNARIEKTLNKKPKEVINE